jgi:hypothetical protein
LRRFLHEKRTLPNKSLGQHVMRKFLQVFILTMDTVENLKTRLAKIQRLAAHLMTFRVPSAEAQRVAAELRRELEEAKRLGDPITAERPERRKKPRT